MNILGINYQGLHDSSACIVRDGEVLFASAEERLSRVKHDSGFPKNAIKACLQYARLTPEQLDYICFGWPLPYKSLRHDLRCYSTGKLPHQWVSSIRNYLTWRSRKGGMRFFTEQFGSTSAKVLHVDHHLAHAISAYAFSGFTDATVVVIDGHGASETTSIWHGKDGSLEHVLTVPWPNSLGLFYAEMTYYLGFKKYSDEWKVMGLAPYGKPGVNLDAFIDSQRSPYWVNARRLLGQRFDDASGIESILGPKRIPESDLEQQYKDVAFAVQDACEKAMLQVVKMAVEKTQCRNLCMAGGVAMNSKANGKILTSSLVDQVFIQPAATDDGTALGAGLAPYLETQGQLPVSRMRSAYLGPEFSDAETETALNTYKLRYIYLTEPSKTAAELLAEGKIVGWFQGRMEFGPRALGNRSILADPRSAAMKDEVNNVVKFREVWRPFAPSMLAEAAPDYLQNVTDSPFMILTDQVKPEKQSVIAAVTHVDGSTRPQTVEKEINPRYWSLIKAFEQLTGVPVVMNTSFNLRGEPIVCTPTEAIRTFMSSGMDALVLGNYLLKK
ncbi:MAG: carbamoyltransferase [Cyanobacteria bacterium J06634_6]